MEEHFEGLKETIKAHTKALEDSTPLKVKIYELVGKIADLHNENEVLNKKISEFTNKAFIEEVTKHACLEAARHTLSMLEDHHLLVDCKSHFTGKPEQIIMDLFIKEFENKFGEKP